MRRANSGGDKIFAGSLTKSRASIMPSDKADNSLHCDLARAANFVATTILDVDAFVLSFVLYLINR